MTDPITIVHAVLAAPGIPSAAPAGASAPAGDTATTATTQDAAGANSPLGDPNATPPANPFNLLLPIMLGLFLFMIVMQIFAGRKQKKRRDEMLGGIKKSDTVQTSGGMIGTVVEIKDDELVLKIDAENNIRARFARSAVQNVIKSNA